jgi:hypothetical protein
MCVLPDIGARFVRKDFDAAAEGFEEVMVPEQPLMILASEVGADAALEDMDGMEGLERHLESDVFVQAVANGVANVLREALAKVSEDAAALSDASPVTDERSQHSEGAPYA